LKIKSPAFKSLVLVMIVFQMGCSTLMGVQNSETEVYFSSNAPKTEVICAGRHAKTPGSVALLKSRKHFCTAEAQGFEKETLEIPSGPSWSGFLLSTAMNTAAWGWWTLGIGTGVGWLIDLASGAMNDLKVKEKVQKGKKAGKFKTARGGQ
jgi:hypothetical protein